MVGSVMEWIANIIELESSETQLGLGTRIKGLVEETDIYPISVHLTCVTYHNKTLMNYILVEGIYDAWGDTRCGIQMQYNTDV